MSQIILPQDPSTRPMAKTRKAKPRTRTFVQIFFFALVVLITLNEAFEKAGLGLIPFISKASLHAICPFGGVVSIYEFVTEGNFVQKIHQSSFILMIVAFVLAIGFGPVICGWICPFGSFQEWIGKVGKKIFGKKYNKILPEKIDRSLRYLRYGILVWVLYVTAVSTKLLFQDYDPYYALFNFWSGEVALSALIILGLTVLLSLFIERPWCKYACPYGAVLGIFNRFRIFKIRRDTDTCIQCQRCDKACPMNLTVSKSAAIYDHQCISCMKCTSENICPVANTVVLATKGEQLS